MKTLIAPSMLAADAARLADEAARITAAGADWIHLDVMDGHFVPNLTIGPQVVAALRPATRLPFDVHLMIERPEEYLESFVRAGADRVTVHAEACRDLKGVVAKIRQLKVKAGVALRPQTPLSALSSCLGDLDLVLLMTVNPGFGGQQFMPEVLPKITQLRRDFPRHIQVDGGINHETGRQTVEHGADVLVAGTYVFGAADLRQAMECLRGAAPPPARAPTTSVPNAGYSA
ncbi:MAG: ribulose-phosphate 3-epimerase [Omnitrophica WOR_2 bacterium RIFCSPHIGHO2_02_FULL_68_15]|nr:MAG: ribulose-phosphate 3-epimerase [Omnitrophica WOR_2 bacterium RIFCSPHIGHO2_02_FULL_68_15]